MRSDFSLAIPVKPDVAADISSAIPSYSDLIPYMPVVTEGRSSWSGVVEFITASLESVTGFGLEQVTSHFTMVDRINWEMIGAFPPIASFEVEVVIDSVEIGKFQLFGSFDDD